MHIHEASRERAGLPRAGRGLGVAFAWRGVASGVFVHMHEANQEEAGPLRPGGPIAGPLALWRIKGESTGACADTER